MTLADRFKTVFNTDVQTYACFHGFDILKFDDEFIKSKRGSMKNAIVKRFGTDAACLIKELCNVSSPTQFYHVPAIK